MNKKDTAPEEKFCNTCHETKPINTGRAYTDGFYKRNDTADGYRSQCKACYKTNRLATKLLKNAEKLTYEPRYEETICSPDLAPEGYDVRWRVDFKKCTSCGEYKHLDDYHNHHRAKDGKHSSCKLCRLDKEYERRHRTNKEEYNTYDPMIYGDEL